MSTMGKSNRWRGIIGQENVLTGDGRCIQKGALQWDAPPLLLRYVSQDVGMHDGAQVVGRILTIERKGTDIYATGDFDLASDVGREAYRQVDEGLTTGVSMDLDNTAFEVQVRAEIAQRLMNGGEADEEPMPEPNAEGRVVVDSSAPDDFVQFITGGNIRASTLVAIPAFAKAHIEIDPTEVADDTPGPASEGTTTTTTTAKGKPAPGAAPADTSKPAPVPVKAAALTLVASIPFTPPLDWFRDPKFAGPTPLEVKEDGRIYGHLALWGTCHNAFSAGGECITPPESPSSYAHFRTGAILTAEGEEVSVGHVTLDTKHAGSNLSPQAAVAHYDNTGSVVADVAAGEDGWGIWVAGALRPEATQAQIRALRSAPLSGDWRRLGGRLDLVAILAVNVQGFTVPRPAGFVASGALQSLVASGILPHTKMTRSDLDAISDDDLRYLKQLVRQSKTDAAAALAARVNAVTNLSKVRQFARKVGVF